MINLNRLNDISYIKAKQAALIIARRTATPAEQRAINIELNIIYDAKLKALKLKGDTSNGNSY